VIEPLLRRNEKYGGYGHRFALPPLAVAASSWLVWMAHGVAMPPDRARIGHAWIVANGMVYDATLFAAAELATSSRAKLHPACLYIPPSFIHITN
jgi:hypothetical protein